MLVMTFKPAVADAWQTDLESHVDFDGWQFLTRDSDGDPTKIAPSKPLVYFGSLQDLLGRDKATGNIKPKNQWIHKVKWDLVVFDEYHFGAWRESAKELVEGEEERIAREEAELECGQQRKKLRNDLKPRSRTNKSHWRSEFLPITTKAYLYLSGTPFKALATGEFIEEADFQLDLHRRAARQRRVRAKEPRQVESLRRVAQMRLLTYQMPDELITIASAGEFDEFDLNAFFEASGEGKKAQFKHKSDVQKWLDIIRGGYAPKTVERAQDRHASHRSRIRTSRLLPYLQHSFWFLPNVAACHAMANLLAEKQNVFWHDYDAHRCRWRHGGHRLGRAAARARGHRQRL